MLEIQLVKVVKYACVALHGRVFLQSVGRTRILSIWTFCIKNYIRSVGNRHDLDHLATAGMLKPKSKLENAIFI